MKQFHDNEPEANVPELGNILAEYQAATLKAHSSFMVAILSTLVRREVLSQSDVENEILGGLREIYHQHPLDKDCDEANRRADSLESEVAMLLIDKVARRLGIESLDGSALNS